MTKIGYARVSTTDQDLDVQLTKLKEQGCDIVRSEKVTGASRVGRDELNTIIDFLRPDDELVVARLDRLGRDTRDVLNIIHECERNCSGSWHFERFSHDDPVDGLKCGLAVDSCC